MSLPNGVFLLSSKNWNMSWWLSHVLRSKQKFGSHKFVCGILEKWRNCHWDFVSIALKLEPIFGQVGSINNSKCVRSFNLSIGLLVIISDAFVAHLPNVWCFFFFPETEKKGERDPNMKCVNRLMMIMI